VINFEPFLEAVGQQMQPVGRVQHLIGMLQQLLTYTPDDVTMADLATGWRVLALPKSQNEEASFAHRRKICADLSIIAAQFTNEPGNLANAVKTWQAWQDAFQRSHDPRQTGMVKILARELMELQSVS
jgi:hypothetical protein